MPKSSELDEEVRAKLLAYLKSRLGPLGPAGTVHVPHLELTPGLVQVLGTARRSGHLKGGLENIQTILLREETGLLALQGEEGEAGGASDLTVSRLLLVSNDGSARFYRACERTLERYGKRIITACLDVSGDTLGQQFFGKGATVKAVMVAKKDLVVKVLLAMLGER